MEKEISIPAFAKMVGVSKQSIYKAVKSGRIKEGITSKNKIIPSIAKKEYESTADPIQAGRKRKANPKPKPSPESQSGEFSQSEANAPEDDEGQLLIDFNKSRAEKMAYEAKIKKMDYEKRKGSLVSREAVDKGLFEVGTALRKTFLALPDRLIDDIMASDERNEAHAILFKGINDALEQFANAGAILEKEIYKEEL